MSKTFKCVEHEEEVLEVYPFIGDEGGRKFSLLMPHVSSDAGIAFDSTTAPALALAILEAAGHGGASDSSCLMQAFDLIELHVKEQERVTAEAEAQAKLEAEALALENARCEALQVSGFNSFDDLPAHKQMTGLAVARRAREMRAEK